MMINSFAKQSNDKAKQPNDKASNYTAHNLHKLSSCVFADDFREFPTINAVYEEIFKLHIFIESRQEYFLKRNAFIKEDAAFCFLLV